jgi:hypothetical protein
VEPALVPTAPPELVAGSVDTPRFHILYTKRSEGSSRQLANGIESIRDAFQNVLGRDWPGTTEVRVGMGREEFEALALPGASRPAGRWRSPTPPTASSCSTRRRSRGPRAR